MKLGDVSPLAGLVTGEGLMGKLTSLGGLGLVTDAIRDDEEKRKKKEAENGVAPTGAPMKKGGKVSSASSRADGCCIKGKTRGKMV